MLRLPEYAYHRPISLEEALRLLDEHAGNVLPIAGGTDAIPNMKHRLLTPAHLVSLKGLPELRGIEVREGELRIGAAETLATVSRHPLVLEHAPALARAAGLVAGPQLRNMGTFGGNLCLGTRRTYYNQTHFPLPALGCWLQAGGSGWHAAREG